MATISTKREQIVTLRKVLKDNKNTAEKALGSLLVLICDLYELREYGFLHTLNIFIISLRKICFYYLFLLL